MQSKIYNSNSQLGSQGPKRKLTSEVPVQMSLMWSQMALAADMALESFLALMTAAPRCCTVCETEEEWNNNKNIMIIRLFQSVFMCKLNVVTMDQLKLTFLLLMSYT